MIRQVQNGFLQVTVRMDAFGGENGAYIDPQTHAH